ncbi:MAG: radical SAM protein [Candidatus Firestonebacteria bacterium]|nr:radical SAM protein [Candidatus Firestonebacteria bacterium]
MINWRNWPVYYFWRFYKWQNKGDMSPIVASFKLTQRCNLRCTHCPWLVSRDTELTIEEWKRKADYVWAQGCTVVVIEGGEPTLRKDLNEIIDYCRFIGLYVILISNGTRPLAQYNPNVIWISMEGTKTTHDSIRGEGMFDKSFQTIKELYKKKHIITLTTLSPKNIGDIEPMCETLMPYLDGMWFSYVYPYKNIQDTILTSKEKQESAMLIMKLKKEKYRDKIFNSYTFLKEVGRGWTCYPWLMIIITSNGDVKNGCMIDHLERYNCKNCDLACNGELSKLYEAHADTRKAWAGNVGVPITLNPFEWFRVTTQQKDKKI